jgi:uroporphyrinogen decarboxylase
MREFNDRFLRACRREPVDCTPIWLMRQAGRYQPEYRALRAKHTMLELCTTAELAAEVTRMPLRRFDFDAAILFSDLTIPFTPMGAPFVLQENVGPVISDPIRSREDVRRLRPIEPEADLAFALEAIRILRAELKAPLIGFAGAPFTLAAYLIEGRGSKDFARARALMYSDPETWHALLELLAENTYRYLRAQIEAGAQAVQVFDSWVGVLAPHVYREYVAPHMRRIFEGLRGLGAPVIHFGTGTAALLEQMRDAGGDVIGVDWRVPLAQAWARLGDGVAVQGNLDPAALLGDADTVRREAQRVLAEAGGRPGHIFNLGHGILPSTPLDNVERLVEVVHGGVGA